MAGIGVVDHPHGAIGNASVILADLHLLAVVIAGKLHLILAGAFVHTDHGVHGEGAGSRLVDEEFRLGGHGHIRPLVAVHLGHLNRCAFIIAGKVDAHIHAAGKVAQQIPVGEEGQNQRGADLGGVIAAILRLSGVDLSVLVAAVGIQREGHVPSAGGVAGDADAVGIDVVDVVMDVIHELQHAQSVVAAIVAVLLHGSRGIARAVGVHIEHHKAPAGKLDGGDVLSFQGSMIAVACDDAGCGIVPGGRGGLVDQHP